MTLPFDTTTHKHSRAFFMIGFLILILVCAAIVFIPIRGASFIGRMSMVHALRGVYVAQDFPEPVQPKSFGLFNLKDYAVADSGELLSSLAERGNTRIVVTRPTAEVTPQVRLLLPEAKALSSGPGAKASIAISPDEEYVAYSVASANDQPTILLSGWTIHLMNLSTESDLELGTGFDAQFFTRDGITWLAYTSPKGITTLNTETLQSFTTPFNLGDFIGIGLRISPDGAFLAMRDAAQYQFTLYAIKSVATDSRLNLQPLKQDIHSFSDVLLTDTGVLGVDSIPDASGRIAVRTAPYGSSESARLLYTFASERKVRFISSSSL